MVQKQKEKREYPPKKNGKRKLRIVVHWLIVLKIGECPKTNERRKRKEVKNGPSDQNKQRMSNHQLKHSKFGRN